MSIAFDQVEIEETLFDSSIKETNVKRYLKDDFRVVLPGIHDSYDMNQHMSLPEHLVERLRKLP